MRKISIILFFFFCSISLPSFAQMTDSQVLEYIKKENATGKSDTQIGRELLSKGVTPDQLKKIKEKYAGDEESGKKDIRNNVNRKDKKTGKEVGKSKKNPRSTYDSSEDENEDEFLSDKGDEEPNLMPEDVIEKEPGMQKDTSGIFGHSIFYNRNLTFEPNENSATPDDYKLGPGDEIIVELWGENEANIQETISPEGRINISQIGQVSLNGLTIKDATIKLKRILASKYENVSNLTVSLGAIRTIQVNVMAEVNTPGTYRLSPFSTVFNAIYRAGGVTPQGSLRNIQIVRGGKVVGVADLYKYIFDGASETDIRLQEGDAIIVPAYDKIITVDGKVKRPMKYELSGSETLADALQYAGGFAGDAYREYVSVNRITSKGRSVVTSSESELSSCIMADGDIVNVLSVLERKHSGLKVQGYVFQPGEYAFGNGISTVSQLIRAAGGLREDAFLGRAVIQRTKDDLSLKTLSVNLGAIMKGSAPDVQLEKNDILIVSGIYELKDQGILTINGMVSNPGIFQYADHTTIEDLIVLAGGMLDGASSARVDVARRIVDANNLFPTDEIGETYSFPIKNGLVVDGADDFFLEPYDVVSVRQSPGFQNQSFVTLTGEVSFPGEYVLLTKGERISDVVKRAGGITKNAYAKGAVLKRKMSEEELQLAEATRKMSLKGVDKDSLDFVNVSLSDVYSVGIQFDKALEQPGSMYDVILEDGDELIIPEFQYTVKIQGEVLYPNTVVYVHGKDVNYYINQAGGFSNQAKRSRVYIVFLNGQVSRAGRSRIEPGCEIIVPSKPDKAGLSVAEMMSIGTTAASLGTMVASLVNMLKK